MRSHAGAREAALQAIGMGTRYRHHQGTHQADDWGWFLFPTSNGLTLIAMASTLLAMASNQPTRDGLQPDGVCFLHCERVRLRGWEWLGE